MIRRTKAIVTFAGLLAASLPVSAQRPTPQALPAVAPVRAIAALTINGRAVGETWLVILGEDVLVPVATLEAAGLRWVRASETSINGEPHVSLASITPALAFTFMSADGELHLQAPVALFGSRSIVGRQVSESSSAAPRTRSAFMNYGITAGDRGATQVSLEAGVRLGGGVWQGTLSRANRTLARGPVTFTLDDERRLWRWTVGDGAVLSGMSQVARPMLGVTVESEFGIDPLTTVFGPVTFEGGASTPSVADVYVNNQLVARTPVDPGTFNVRVPVQTGAGDVRVVLRDAFGRTQEFVQDYYRSPGLVRPGLHVFRYSAGILRTHTAGFQWRYQDWAASGTHRVGVTPWLTVGGTASVISGRWLAGPDVAFRLPLGEAEVNLRASRANPVSRGAWSSAGIATYVVRGRRTSLQMTARIASAGGQDLGLGPEWTPRRLMWAGGADTAVGRGVSVGVRYRPSQVGGVFSFPLPGRLNASTTWWRGVGDSRAWSALAVVTVPVARRTSASLVYDVSSGRSPVSQVAVQRSHDLGPGLAAQAQWQDAGSLRMGSASVQYRGSAGQIEARRDVVGGIGVNGVTFSGSVVAVDRRIRLARPVTDSFAVVNVGGLAGVRTYLSNQFAGRTGRGGDVVLPSLTAYSPNLISIDDRDIPLNLDVSRSELAVAPAFRSGSLVRFPVIRVSDALPVPSSTSTVRAIGRVLLGLPAEALADAVATATWGSRDEERVAVRNDGRFEFQRASVGTHTVDITTTLGSYACTIVIRPDAVQADGSQAVGDLQCQSAPVRATKGGGR